MLRVDAKIMGSQGVTAEENDMKESRGVVKGSFPFAAPHHALALFSLPRRRRCVPLTQHGERKHHGAVHRLPRDSQRWSQDAT